MSTIWSSNNLWRCQPHCGLIFGACDVHLVNNQTFLVGYIKLNIIYLILLDGFKKSVNLSPEDELQYKLTWDPPPK